MIKLLGRILSPKQWASGWIEDRPYKRRSYSKIIAISNMIKQDIIKWYNVPGGEITVVYNGVDTERFHPRNGRYREEVRSRHGIANEFVILFVSNNFKLKGLEFLMRALARIKEEGFTPFRLLILGKDRQKPYLQLAKHLGIPEEVIFAGSTQEPEKYYGAADLFVHPAFYDAFSLAVLEALASGLPVITTASAGASEILNHGEDGFVLKKIKDLSEMETAIRYFSQESVRHDVSRLGRVKATMHSDRVNFDGVRRVLKDAADGGMRLKVAG
jgi:UDP-glucose:(heptosyl)LPS alpha-1,3-glucosyltransferase